MTDTFNIKVIGSHPIPVTIKQRRVLQELNYSIEAIENLTKNQAGEIIEGEMKAKADKELARFLDPSNNIISEIDI